MQFISNAAMTAVCRNPHDLHSGELPGPLQTIVNAGMSWENGCLRLAAGEVSTPAPGHFDAHGSERWTNKIHLDHPEPAPESEWRLVLLEQGLELVRRLIPVGIELTEFPVQATVSLQSSPHGLQPDDFACGAVHIYCLREPADDARANIDGFTQPVLIATGSSRATAAGV